jgi:hypothetical protein
MNPRCPGFLLPRHLVDVCVLIHGDLVCRCDHDVRPDALQVQMPDLLRDHRRDVGRDDDFVAVVNDLHTWADSVNGEGAVWASQLLANLFEKLFAREFGTCLDWPSGRLSVGLLSWGLCGVRCRVSLFWRGSFWRLRAGFALGVLHCGRVLAHGLGRFRGDPHGAAGQDDCEGCDCWDAAV